eukprot:1147320-Rhodomonas_salina.4
MRTLFDNSLHPLSLSLDLDQIAPVDAPQETISSRQPEVKPVAAAPHQAVQAPQPVQMVRAPSLQLKLLLLARFVRALSHDVMANTETAGCARLPRLLRRCTRHPLMYLGSISHVRWAWATSFQLSELRQRGVPGSGSASFYAAGELRYPLSTSRSVLVPFVSRLVVVWDDVHMGRVSLVG